MTRVLLVLLLLPSLFMLMSGLYAIIEFYSSSDPLATVLAEGGIIFTSVGLTATILCVVGDALLRAAIAIQEEVRHGADALLRQRAGE